MELTEAMRRSGWREMPVGLPDFTGSLWTVKTPIGPMTRDAARMQWATSVVDKWPHRPVNPETWDYDPRGWGDEPSPVVQAEPDENGGAWWYQCKGGPIFLCYISSGVIEIIESPDARSYEGDRIELSEMYRAYHGQWIAPCVKPEVK